MREYKFSFIINDDGSAILGDIVFEKVEQRQSVKNEVAIGFAEFISGEGWQQYDGKDRWICPQNNNDILTTKELFEKYNGSTTIEPIDNKIPIDATDLECFSIKGSEAFIGYKAPNGNFNFIQIPYTEPKKDIEELEEMFKYEYFNNSYPIDTARSYCVSIAKQYAASKTKDLQKDLDLAISEIVKLQMNQITQ